MKTFDLRHAVAITVAFGGFEGLMPLLGWLLASRVRPAASPASTTGSRSGCSA